MSRIKCFSLLYSENGFLLSFCHCSCSHFWDSVAKETSCLRGLISGNIFEWYLMLEIIQILTSCYCTRVNWDSWSLQISRIGGYFFREKLDYPDIRMKPLSKLVHFFGRSRNMLSDIGKRNKKFKEKSWGLGLKNLITTVSWRESPVTGSDSLILLLAAVVSSAYNTWNVWMNTKLVKWTFYEYPFFKNLSILQGWSLQSKRNIADLCPAIPLAHASFYDRRFQAKWGIFYCWFWVTLTHYLLSFCKAIPKFLYFSSCIAGIAFLPFTS